MKKIVKIALVLGSLSTAAWGQGDSDGGSGGTYPDPYPVPGPFSDLLMQSWGSAMLAGVSQWQTWMDASFYNQCSSIPAPIPYPENPGQGGEGRGESAETGTEEQSDGGSVPNDPRHPDHPVPNYYCYDFSVVTSRSVGRCPDGSSGMSESGMGVMYNAPGDAAYYYWSTASACGGSNGNTDGPDDPIGNDDQRPDDPVGNDSSPSRPDRSSRTIRMMK